MKAPAGIAITMCIMQCSTALLLLSVSAAFAQPDRKIAFEVASVRKTASTLSGSNTWNTTPGRLMAANWTLRQYVMIAYDMKDVSHVLKGPGWIDVDRYDVDAKLSTDDTSGNSKENDAAILAAFRELLRERFGLATHKDRQATTVYSLLVAKSGSRLRPSEPGERLSNKWNATKLTSTAASLDTLADVFTRIVGSPVINKTGISGTFDVTLQWTAESRAAMPNETPTPSGPSIFAAIQEQLGLRLEPEKGTREVIVIDTTQKPGEN